MIFQEIFQWPRVGQSPPERQSTTNTTHGQQLSFWPWLHTHPTRRCHREDLSLVRVSSSEGWLATAGTWCSGSTSEPSIFRKVYICFQQQKLLRGPHPHHPARGDVTADLWDRGCSLPAPGRGQLGSQHHQHPAGAGWAPWAPLGSP